MISGGMSSSVFFFFIIKWVLQFIFEYVNLFMCATPYAWMCICSSVWFNCPNEDLNLTEHDEFEQKEFSPTTHWNHSSPLLEIIPIIIWWSWIIWLCWIICGGIFRNNRRKVEEKMSRDENWISSTFLLSFRNIPPQIIQQS